MVGEDIETCLAAMQATGHVAWAALSTSGLRARLLWRQQFRERVAQFQPVKRLLQHWKTLVAVWQADLVIAGRKDEGHAARGERVGDGVAHLPVEIDIEHRVFLSPLSLWSLLLLAWAFSAGDN